MMMHMGWGTAPDGTRIISSEASHSMQFFRALKNLQGDLTYGAGSVFAALIAAADLFRTGQEEVELTAEDTAAVITAQEEELLKTTD